MQIATVIIIHEPIFKPPPKETVTF